MTRWQLSYRADPMVVPLADRHYNRQKIGAPQYAPPGRCLVFKAQPLDAFWITSWPFAEYVKHAWPGAWVCSAFRNEGASVASELITEAVAATRWYWPAVPTLGMISFVDPLKVKPTMRRGKPMWGYCFLKAGFRLVGETKGGLLAFQLAPDDMPAAAPAVGMSEYLQPSLLGLEAA